MPSFKICGIDLSSFLTMVHNLLIITIFKLLDIFVRLKIFKLPRAELVVTYAQKLWLNVLWFFKQVHQDMLCLVKRVLISVRSTLVVKCLRNGDLNPR